MVSFAFVDILLVFKVRFDITAASLWRSFCLTNYHALKCHISPWPFFLLFTEHREYTGDGHFICWLCCRPVCVQILQPDGSAYQNCLCKHTEGIPHAVHGVLSGQPF
jgi:hypothetical protein